jgi:hypothetical protein
MCSCGRTVGACIATSLPPFQLGSTNPTHDRLVLQRFVDDAERSSPLKRARLAFEVRSILIERGRIKPGQALDDHDLRVTALDVVEPCERVS